MRKLLLVLLVSLPLAFPTGFDSARYAISSRVYTYHGIDVECHVFSPRVESASLVAHWKVEVARRFPGARLFVCHGLTLDGQWFIFPQDGRPMLASKAAQRLRSKEPGRVIVFIVCNPDGVPLGMPGVYHAKQSVWFEPDKNYVGDERDHETCGNIFEFTDE